MNREEIIKLIWDRMQFHLKDAESTISSAPVVKSFEDKQILNFICTPAELRKLQEGGKL